MKLTYTLRVLSGARFKKLFKILNSIHEKTNKNRFILFLDIINCAIRYGAGYNDYDIFEFYNIKHDKRKTFVTRFKNKKIIMMLNDPDFADIFDKKNQFAKKFKKYLGRDVLDMKTATLNDFKKFIQNKDTIFVKPNDGDSGRGIEKLQVCNYNSISSLYDYIKSKNFGVAEEPVVQHPQMAKLHPDSVNCLRIQTIVVNGKPEVVYAVCKAGNGGHYVDNLGFDGINIPIDLNTGKLIAVGRTEHKETYTVHPYTNIKFEGFEIPYLKEAIDMCLEAALEVPEIGFVGWDVFISENGPGIIEGNDYPDYYFWQLPEHTPNRTGILPYYQKLLPKL